MINALKPLGRSAKISMITTFAAVATVALVVSGCASTRVTVPVKFSNVTPGAPQEIVATLVRPAGEGPFPAVVLLHGCEGLGPRSYGWARWLADRGYVALVLDSFGPRKLKGDCRTAPNEPPITARFDDAFGALRYLQSQAYVVHDRIAVIGWSQGGVYAMSVINGPSLERAQRRGVELPAVGFAAGIGVYPGGCFSLVNEQVVRPLLVLIGEADDWTPAEKCVEMVNAMKSRGADVEIVVYPGAYHYFDKEGQRKEFLPEVENDSKPGGFGATVAYQPEAAADAYRRVEAFLARHLSRPPR
jgi:dienelactone hydrolase